MQQIIHGYEVHEDFKAAGRSTASLADAAATAASCLVCLVFLFLSVFFYSNFQFYDIFYQICCPKYTDLIEGSVIDVDDVTTLHR